MAPRFVKLIAPLIIGPLLHLFNTCITKSAFPMIWKRAHVIPIPKRAAATTPADYRPISLLCFLSKVLEKLLYWQVQQYTLGKGLISMWQSGFRPKHSCESALLKVTTDIRAALDKREITILTLLDFSKAFDSVCHGNLLRKLLNYFSFSHGATQLIGEFLSGRSQRVTLKDNNCSDFLPLHCGVPQGSVLGPLLFSLYINDLPETIHDVNIHIFADDVQVYLNRPIGLIEDCVARINSDLHNIYTWSLENKLKLNPSKSQCIAFSAGFIDTSTLPSILLNGFPIPYENKVRNLGVILNSNMKCCDVINSNISKIYATLRRLWLSAGMLSPKIRCHLVKTLILQHFTHGSLVFPKLDSHCARKVHIAFNDCIRFVFGLRRFDHVSHLSFALLGCSIESYLKRRALLFLYNLLHSSQPSYLSTMFQPLSSTRGYKLLIPRFRTSILDGSYTVHITRIWNSLPHNIQGASSFGTFRRLLVDFLA